MTYSYTVRFEGHITVEADDEEGAQERALGELPECAEIRSISLDGQVNPED